MESTYKQEFEKKIIPKIKKDLGKGNNLSVPKLEKIIVNASTQEFIKDKKQLEKTIEDIATITGQKPQVIKAKVSVSAFKLREGMDIGVRVTLRGKRMYDFFEKLVKIVLPRVKDFSGVDDKAFDGHGNMSIGFREHIVFPEIDPGKVDRARSLQLVIVTSAESDDEAKTLLKEMGMPFVKGEK